MTYLPRRLAATCRRASRTFPAVLVTGPRQSGKTTLLTREHGATHRFVSLERPDVRQRALADPVGFFAENPPPLILDEIQYAPELLHYVKEAIDRDRRPGRWLLSGSQSLTLMQGISQTLAGRVAVLVLDPLATNELAPRPAAATIDAALERLVASPAPEAAGPVDGGVDLADWLLRGGFPEPRLNPEVDAALWFSSYVQTYLERDLRDLLGVGDLASFGRFLSLVAARTGTLLNMADLGRDAGVTGPTVRRWLSVLEATHLVHLLRPHHRSYGKRVTKSPKLYLMDPGLATYLLGLRQREAVLQGPSIGALLETAVVSEWAKLFHQHGERPPLYFYRASGLEVDLVIEWSGRLYGIETKATATPAPSHGAALGRWLELAGDGARGAVACRVAAPVPLGGAVRAVPWHLAW